MAPTKPNGFHRVTATREMTAKIIMNGQPAWLMGTKTDFNNLVYLFNLDGLITWGVFIFNFPQYLI